MTLELHPQQPITPEAIDAVRGQTIGEYACSIIAQQYYHLIEQEAGVRADCNPEYLHQMRVGCRRLRTALQVFKPVITLPKQARAHSIRAISQILGRLRDLDVQIASIETDYSPRIQAHAEQRLLRQTLKQLKHRRGLVLIEVRTLLTSPSYQEFKRAYEKWLRFPRYKPMGTLPLQLVLPDLLNPLISKLLLHPGWLITLQESSTPSRQTLHNLRKLCKHVRYQAEFFSPFYGPSFRSWIQELKIWQDNLGTVQDIYVFRELMATQTGPPETTPAELHQITETSRHQALQGWEELRHRYLDLNYRRSLYGLILYPQDQTPEIA
ncbi:MAG: CHAD domain-containing protein [Cyanobacteria bacterium REEB459]|nr:CHAD domain-containing protein [Cyanobacteria bacterium REEB459]